MPAKRQYKKKRNFKRKTTGGKRKRATNPYRRSNVVALQRALNPIAEGRKFTTAGISTTMLAADWNVIIPNSWEKMVREQALEDQPTAETSKGFTGNTLFSRYINMHLQLNFEQINHISTPVNMRIMFGWAKIPYVTQYQSTGAGTSLTRNAQGVLIHYDPTAFLKQQLERQYDQLLPVNDPKKFKLFHNKEYFIMGQQGSGIEFDSSGTPLDSNRINRRTLDFHPEWKPMRKYHMMSATATGGSAVANTNPDDYFPPMNVTQAFWTPSNTKQELWYPFIAINFKNHDSYGRNPDGSTAIAAYPNYVQKNAHYFYDL